MLCGKKGWRILWEPRVRAPVTEPQGLPSERHRKDTNAHDAEHRTRPPSPACFCPLLSSSLTQRSDPEWGNAPSIPPLAESRKASSTGSSSLRILNAAIRCTNYYVFLRNWSVMPRALSLYRVILLFLVYLLIFHYSRSSVLLISVFPSFPFYFKPSCMFIFKENLSEAAYTLEPCFFSPQPDSIYLLTRGLNPFTFNKLLIYLDSSLELASCFLFVSSVSFFLV